MIDGDDCGAVGGINEWQGKQQYSEKTCPNAALFTADPTRLGRCLNRRRRGRKPATDSLSYGTIQDSSGYVRFEVFTAVTMKNVVFWDIKSQCVLHRRHITSPIQSPAS
jgi:hypothetical protein